MKKPEKQISDLQAEIERLQMEVEQLRKSGVRFRAMSNNIALGLYRRTCGSAGKLILVNSAMAQLFGYDDPAELQNMPIRQLYWNPEECKTFSDEVLVHGNVIRGELKMKHKDGSPIWIKVTATIICHKSGKPQFFDGIMEDITAQKTAMQSADLQQQQLIQADKMITLGILVSGVAHEINNPNQFIVSHIAPLKKIWQDVLPILDRYYEENGDFLAGGGKFSDRREKVPEMFANVLKGSQRIRHIVEELRDYAREQPFEMKENVQINEVVDSALALLANLLKKSTTQLTVECAVALPLITGDFQRIEQVVINLLQNACQALTDNSAAIKVRTFMDEASNSVAVEIIDQGCGITAEQLQHIRDPFFTTRRETGGTGLGLSISDIIIKKHGGTLRFKSEVEVGTTATVTFPVVKVKEVI
ncbi:MAG: PAS domain-containing protein [Pirellulales bacterium]|nr:PAS domain-containing protein [Pirellulales bacterium]